MIVCIMCIRVWRERERESDGKYIKPVAKKSALGM